MTYNTYYHINGSGGYRLWQPVQTESQPKSSGLVLGRRPLGAVLHSSYEPGELSQWLSHDENSTINIVLDIIIIIIIIDILEKCTTTIHQWLLHNGLQLNPSKPKAILFTTGRGQLYDIPSLQVSDTVIQMSATIKRLGVTLDHHLTFDQHVANVCKACYFHICSTVSQVVSVARAVFITSQLTITSMSLRYTVPFK